MDITILFNSCVKVIKTRNRGLYSRPIESERTSILSTRDRKCEFASRSRDILQQITRLREFLLRHKNSYVNRSNYLAEFSDMSDYERDDIETRAQKIITGCSAFIDMLEKKTRFSNNQQYIEHKRIVLELTRNYLKDVCKTYAELKNLRLQRSIELREMAKMGSKMVKRDADRVRRSRIRLAMSDAALFQSEDLSQEELQVFEHENNRLYNDLNCLSDEIQQIKRKVVKIAELQGIFTEKVLEQDKDIERIGAIVTGTTENLKDANDQIRQAIQRNAGLRVWILFFLLVISFSLLFLDWYND